MHSCTHAKGEIDNESLITGFSMKSGIYLSILIEMTIIANRRNSNLSFATT